VTGDQADHPDRAKKFHFKNLERKINGTNGTNGTAISTARYTVFHPEQNGTKWNSMEQLGTELNGYGTEYL